MKKRSLGKIAAYSLLTLGIYQFFWFVETRREMTALTGIRIPGAQWIVGLGILNVVATGLLIYAVIFMLTPSARQVAISQPCWQQYVINGTPDPRETFTRTNKSPLTYTPACQQEVAESYQASSRQSLAIKIIFGMFVLLPLALLAFYRWLYYYTAAVTRVIGGKLSHEQAMLTLGLLPYVGVIVVQDAFNRFSSSTMLASGDGPLMSTDNKSSLSAAARDFRSHSDGPEWLKKILVAIIIIMLALMSLGVLGVYILSR